MIRSLGLLCVCAQISSTCWPLGTKQVRCTFWRYPGPWGTHPVVRWVAHSITRDALLSFTLHFEASSFLMLLCKICSFCLVTHWSCFTSLCITSPENHDFLLTATRTWLYSDFCAFCSTAEISHMTWLTFTQLTSPLFFDSAILLLFCSFLEPFLDRPFATIHTNDLT